MELIEILTKANEDKCSSYHEFLQNYRADLREIYGFVEGVTDPSYYEAYIANKLPDGWNVELYPAGNRDKVFSIFSEFDWARFDRHQILFFVDRDLSDFMCEERFENTNIYITDFYSIESNAVNADAIDVIIRDFTLDRNMNSELKQSIVDQFTQSLMSFQLLMTDVMSWILHWKKESKKRMDGKGPCLSDLSLDDIFFVDKDTCILKERPGGICNVKRYMHYKCGISLVGSDEDKFRLVKAEYLDKNNNFKYVRGKYLVWFACKFIKSVKIKSKRNKDRSLRFTVNFEENNYTAILGNKLVMPNTLRAFIEQYPLEFIRNYQAA